MNRFANLRGNIDGAFQKILQSGTPLQTSSAKTLAQQLARTFPDLMPREMADDIFEDFVQCVAIELGYLLPGGTRPAVPIDSPFSLNNGAIGNARSAQVADGFCQANRIPIATGGAAFAMDDQLGKIGGAITRDDDDQAGDGRQRNVLRAIIALGDTAPKDPAALAALLLSRDSSLKASNQSLAEFAIEILATLDLMREASGRGSPLSVERCMTNDRAEEIANGMAGSNRRAEKTPPGMGLLRASMTPEQQQRFDKITASQGRDQAAKKEASLDLFMDFLEQKVGQR